MSIKNKGIRAKILKKKYINISEEEKEKIKEELLEKREVGQTINYQEFLELYETYKNIISEIDFASILGISYSNYMNIKHKNLKAKISGYVIATKTNRIKFLLRESRYYSKQELEEISNKFGLSILKILQLIFNLKNENILENLKDCLEVRGKLWIGNVSCSKEFSERYSKYMIDTAIKIGNNCCKKYECEMIKDDIISNSILFIIEKCGSIEKNYLNEEQIKMAIACLIGGSIKKNCLCYKSNISQSLFVINSEGEEINPYDREIEDKSIDAEKEVIETISKEEIEQYKNLQLEVACLKLLKKYIEIGYTESEAMVEVSKFVGIDINKLIRILKKYMIKQNQVKETSKGSYILK